MPEVADVLLTAQTSLVAPPKDGRGIKTASERSIDGRGSDSSVGPSLWRTGDANFRSLQTTSQSMCGACHCLLCAQRRGRVTRACVGALADKFGQSAVPKEEQRQETQEETGFGD
jgi:hypothetical protein